MENLKIKYQLKKNFLVGGFLFLHRCLDRFLVFFSLKQSKQYWGIIYDSVSKQPLDPVIVKLLYVDGKEVETRITDMDGRYGFLARPGKFKIFARKSNYLFPSRKVSGSRDGIFENLYHGEFFSLAGDAEVVAPNIPMDPEKFDWNQEAKRQIVDNWPFLKLFVKKLAATLFWFGFLFVLLAFWQNYPAEPAYIYVLAGIYVLLSLLAAVVKDTRLWGKLKIKNQAEDLGEIFMELKYEKFLEINLDKSLVREDGKFLLRARPGKYLLRVLSQKRGEPPRLLAQRRISVGWSGVVNGSFVLKGD